jgi:hypothetical protein
MAGRLIPFLSPTVPEPERMKEYRKDTPLIYCHIPKMGGVSIREVFSAPSAKTCSFITTRTSSDPAF